MSISNFISELKNSNLYAECDCGEEFKLSEAVLFDGLGQFPVEALEKKGQMEEMLSKMAEDLKKKRKLATVGAENTAASVGAGKLLEKVIPTLSDFPLQLTDCRFMGDPIDLVVFNGITKNKVDSLSFIEVKSGNARLNAHQKAVKEAVDDEKVSYGEIP